MPSSYFRFLYLRYGIHYEPQIAVLYFKRGHFFFFITFVAIRFRVFQFIAPARDIRAVGEGFAKQRVLYFCKSFSAKTQAIRTLPRKFMKIYSNRTTTECLPGPVFTDTSCPSMAADRPSSSPPSMLTLMTGLWAYTTVGAAYSSF